MIKNLLLPAILVIASIFFCNQGNAQCSPQTGTSPLAAYFHSGKNDAGYSLNPGSKDMHWKVSMDSINGPYLPAIVMGKLDPIYYQSQFPDCSWISVSETGEHGGSHYFYFKFDFSLPCFNNCGISFNEANTFCLNLELFADNSISEVYVNDKPQSSIIGGMPLPNPFSPGNGHTQSTPKQIQLCRDWKAGDNSLIIEVASSATVVGLLVQKAVHPQAPPDADTVHAIICAGDSYSFAGKDLSTSGYYFNSFTTSSGCDSNVVLDLFVKPQPTSQIITTICKGEIFEGYTEAGVYRNSFDIAGDCDSIRILTLIVNDLPEPDLGPDQFVCEGDSILLTPGNFSTYTWQNGSTGNTLAIKSPGMYSVMVTNGCGSAADQVSVSNGQCEIHFPSAFTPNADGLNDRFGILTHKQLQDYHFIVYNRFGEKIFETYNIADKWDGTHRGKLQAAGSYSWYFTFRENSRLVGKKGSVTLIR